MSAPSSRWHRIFATALEQHAVIGVHEAVCSHLNRTPSRSEANAARRAAHSYAAAGRGRLERVASPDGRQRLVLVRYGIEATPEDLVAAVEPTGTAPGPPTVRAMHTDAARHLVGTVREAAAQARHVHADQLDHADSAALAAALADALSDLRVFRRQLGQRPRTRRSPRPKA